MREDDSYQRVDTENTPKFQDSSDLRLVMAHQKFEGVKNGDVESQDLA